MHDLVYFYLHVYGTPNHLLQTVSSIGNSATVVTGEAVLFHEVSTTHDEILKELQYMA